MNLIRASPPTVLDPLYLHKTRVKKQKITQEILWVAKLNLKLYKPLVSILANSFSHAMHIVKLN